MLRVELPPPLHDLAHTLTSFLDQRHAELLKPLLLGLLLARGRPTATAWFRAGCISEEFRRAYTLLGTVGRSRVDTFAVLLFQRMRDSLDPGSHWLFALDDTPTQRYGPCVEGAGRHHNPTPGPCHQHFVYGHIWVTLAWVVRHASWDVRALPLLADLYIRAADVPKIDADRRPAFVTKLAQAAWQISWLAKQLRGTTKPIWVAVDGAYTKRPVLQRAREEHVVVVGRLPRNAALWNVPPIVPAGRRGPGRPRKYGRKRLILPKRAGQARGWEQVECWQYQQLATKTVKTFAATWKPAGGAILVVLVKEAKSWRAYCCTDPAATARDILEAAAGRTAIEETFKDVKEVEGAGQQQLRYWPANLGAFHWCLWGYTAVEWWAWEKPYEQLCDRDASPWDAEYRRPSHADRRKALQRVCLEEELWRQWGERPCPPEIREWVAAVLDLLG